MRKGSQVWVSRTLNKGRDLKWTWELQRKGKSLVGTNSVTANLLIHWILKHRLVSGLKSHRKVFPERTCQKGVRLDFEVITAKGKRHFIEVKNCHLRYPDGFAYFPDSETMRSVKHLRALSKLVRLGHRASLFVAVQRADILALRPSDFHDPVFSRELRRAGRAGVTIRAFSFKPTVKGFHYMGEIEVDLEPYCLKKIGIWSKANEKHSGWNHWNSKKNISY